MGENPHYVVPILSSFKLGSTTDNLVSNTSQIPSPEKGPNMSVERRTNDFRRMSAWALLCLGLIMNMTSLAAAADQWLTFEGGEGPGKGKHIVLISGDDEYRSEEGLPQLAKILSKHHGFKCTVLFSIDKEGNINPEYHGNIPGLEALKTADGVVMLLRFRDLPDDQMKLLIDYIESGKPIVALRTSTHAFDIHASKTYQKYTWTSNEKGFEGGFGKQVLGETWVSHHGDHGRQSCRGILAPGVESHPILRGIKSGDIWGPTDVYGVNTPLPGDSKPLVLGQVVEGMKPDDKAAEGPKNNPMMPIAWTKTYQGASGHTARTFTTTMGASQDLLSEGLRRLIVNAVYWTLKIEEKIPQKSNVAIVGKYEPIKFGFGSFNKGKKPQDYAATE